MKYSEIKSKASKFRKNPTPEEELLWGYLRKRQLLGKKFLRQHPIIYQSIGNEHFFYIPDFFCFEAKLAVELDGPIHLKFKERDLHRDEILNSMGIRVIRIQNDELKKIDLVLNKISEFL